MIRADLLPYLLRDLQYLDNPKHKLEMIKIIKEIIGIDMESMFGKEKFNDLTKLYVAQVIGDIRGKEVKSNWYSGLVGELFVVRYSGRPPHEGIFRGDYVISGVGNALSVEHNSKSFYNEDIKILCEYPEIKMVKLIRFKGKDISLEEAKGISDWYLKNKAWQT